MGLPCAASETPQPQYSTTDDTAGRTYTAYFVEDGQLKSTMIVVRLRRLRSYWNGDSWVNVTSRIYKTDIPKNTPDDAPAELKYLAKFPNYVVVDDKHVYFDPDEQ